jgi:predicted CopG family antitoxin
MSDYTISIPDELYEKAQRVAQQTSSQVDEVIRTKLEDALDQPLFDLPDDEKEELKAMAYLSDDTLWTIAREQMQKPLQERMSVLMTKNTKGTITDDEYAELTQLVERGNRLTLRKAQAMKYLTERGHKITLDDLNPIDE